MKVRVLVRLKSGVLDVQGKAVERSINENGFPGISALRVGKVIEFEASSGDREQIMAEAKTICEKILVNPIIEQFEIQFPE